MSDQLTAISGQQGMEPALWLKADDWMLDAIVGPETGGLRFI